VRRDRGQYFHSFLIALLVAASLLLRGAIAPGYMPSFAGGKDLWPITICTAQGLSTILVDDQYNPEAPPHHAKKAPCDFTVNTDSVFASSTAPAAPCVQHGRHIASVHAFILSVIRPPYFAQGPPRLS
jgi:hypothetical protein